MDNAKKLMERMFLAAFIIIAVAFVDGFFSGLLGQQPLLVQLLGASEAKYPAEMQKGTTPNAPRTTQAIKANSTGTSAPVTTKYVRGAGNSIERILRAEYFPHVKAAGRFCGLDAAVIVGLISKESSGDSNAFNPNGGGNGAIGLLQIRAPAAIDIGVVHDKGLYDPKMNIEAGTRYLCMKLAESRGDLSHALLGYLRGMGEGKTKEGAKSYIKAGLHPREHPYVSDVLSRIARAKTALGDS